eukprot:TRINITY_DN50111_c0_g1_i1.p1 TRINITY_DN50111_c0_g1~~TRINITY_DN50111_c0_g1_i1.p1  ORF type:complete len:146 (+),score=25.20 TRINITY_DN50111_c0_g1_i1:70-507(+)
MEDGTAMTSPASVCEGAQPSRQMVVLVPARPAKEPAEREFLVSAQRGDSVAVLAAIERHGINILEVLNPRGQTALILAAIEGHVDVTRVLLEHGADVEATDRSQGVPLAYAARAKHVEVVTLLLDYGADVEATDCVVRDMGCVVV